MGATRVKPVIVRKMPTVRTRVWREICFTARTRSFDERRPPAWSLSEGYLSGSPAHYSQILSAPKSGGYALAMIQIVEVGPRDGLQNESVVLDTGQKVEFIERLVGAGARRVEIVSFAHPARVPQMADAEAVAEAFAGRDDFSRIGLVMNERGWQRAQQVELDEINIPVGATEGFNQANVGRFPR